MKRLIVLGAIFGSIGVVLAACGGDSEDLGPVPTFPSIDTPAREAGPAALEAYLRGTGLDGKKGRLTDPFDCALLPDEGAVGDFCIFDDASVYATTLAIIFVADVDKQEEDIWKVRLEVGADTWEVTEAPRVPSE